MMGVLEIFFSDAVPPPDSSHAVRKSPTFGRISKDAEVQRSRERERQQTEVARRASIVDEEFRQQWGRERNVGPSSGVRNTKGAVRVDVSTIEGVVLVDVSTTESAGIVDGSATDGIPSIDTSRSRKPDPPTS
uniref:Integrase core domain containing protein n=1 Tax=Solanum tuberosum TaxID=4113 RepID=M1DW35_SOLTU